MCSHCVRKPAANGQDDCNMVVLSLTCSFQQDPSSLLWEMQEKLRTMADVCQVPVKEHTLMLYLLALSQLSPTTSL